jgi:cytochrome b6-f complex iron-sulfur subunit
VNLQSSTAGAAGAGRRRFLRWFLGTSVTALFASIVYPIVRFLSPPDQPEAPTNEVQVGPINDPELIEKGFKVFRFGNEPVILIKLSETDLRAFSATCTHLDCIVEFRKNQRDIWCNCHNGQYDANGRNIGGPPPRPLTPFAVHIVEKGAGQPALVVVSRAA